MAPATPNVESEDFYHVLGIAPSSTLEAIKKAYKRAAIRFHPDKNLGDAGAEEMFKRVAEAAEVLLDPQRRARYDRGDNESARRSPSGGRSAASAFKAGFSDGVGAGGFPSFGSFATSKKDTRSSSSSSSSSYSSGMDSERARRIFSVFLDGDDDVARHSTSFSVEKPRIPGSGSPARGLMSPLVFDSKSPLGGKAAALSGGLQLPGLSRERGRAGWGAGEGVQQSPLSARLQQSEAGEFSKRCFSTYALGTTVVLVGGPSVAAEQGGRVGKVAGFDEISGNYTVLLGESESGDGDELPPPTPAETAVSASPASLRSWLAGSRVVGVLSRPELNGAVALAAAFDEASGRYRVEGLDLGHGGCGDSNGSAPSPQSPVALKPENLLLPPGTLVRIAAAKSDPGLVGTRGTIVEADGEAGRYSVQLAPFRLLHLRLGAVVAC